MNSNPDKSSLQQENSDDSWTCAVCSAVLSNKISACPNDGYGKSTVALNKVLTSQYELLEELGAGGLGRVFKARHRALNQIVAIKILKTSENDPVTQRRFEQEARIVSTLEHPGIVKVKDFGQAESTQLYMVLEFVAGQSLAQLLQWQGKLTTFEACEVIIQICDAMQYAHEHGVLHRDLKPSNIIFERQEKGIKVTILDFGIAKLSYFSDLTENGLTKTNEVLGSPLYLSPEQASERSSDARSDIYSLGIVLFELITGVPPFTGTNAVELVNQHLHAAMPSIDVSDEKITEAVQSVIEKATAKKPEDRFQTMTEFKQALLDGIYGTGSKAPPAVPVKARVSAKKIAIITMTTVGVACIGISIFAILNSAKLPSFGKPIELQPFDIHEIRQLPPAGKSEDQVAENIIQKNKDSTILDLHGLGLSDEGLRPFQICSKTEEINLKGSRVAGTGLAYLIRLPLRTLSLYDSPVTDRGMAEIGNMQNLESLDLGYTNITDEGAKHLEKLQKLKRLSLKYCNIGDAGIESISKLKNLDLLNLKANQMMTRRGFQLLASMPSLKELRMREADLDEPISGLESSKNLKILDLRESKISDKTLSRLLDTNIEKLNIGHTQVTGEGLLMTAKMKRLKFLRPGHRANKEALAKLRKLRTDLNTDAKIGEETDGF